MQPGIDGSFERTTSVRCHRGRPVLLQVDHKLVRLKPFLIRVPLLKVKNDLNRIYMSYRLEFLLGTFRSLEYSSGIVEISGDPDLIDDSVFDDHGKLLSLLQGVVSLKMSVAVKPKSDLSSEALTDESGENEVLLLHMSTCQIGLIQSTVEAVGGDESVNYARQSIKQDLKFECGLTFTIESRKTERHA